MGAYYNGKRIAGNYMLYNDKLAQVAYGSIKEITARDLLGVKGIRSNAFISCYLLERVEIPDTVIAIMGKAFYGCSSLASVKIGKGIEEIGVSAFYNCGEITVSIEQTTPPTVGSDTFNNCTPTIIVPKGCGDKYKAATNWSRWADYIEEATE